MLGGRYRVEERIGSGGMADVFRARDELLGRCVAVKVFRTATADEESTEQRQEVELQALARLSHPNLITLFDASITSRPAFLVMELVEGPSLSDRIATGPMPDGEVRVIGRQIAEAIAYVHAHGMVHRDVKPANILLGSDGVSTEPRARLSDFGIVRLIGTERMTAADFTLGTALYLAPEQTRGGDVEPAADVYSLGLVLLEALTAVRAYDGTPVEAAIARLSRAPHIPPELPAPWPELLAAMTASDPAQRPTASDVARSLHEGVAALPLATGAFAGSAAAYAAQLRTEAIPLATDADDVPVRSGTTGRLPVAEERGRGPGMFIAAAVLALLIGAAGYFALARSASHAPTGNTTAPSVSQTHRAPARHTTAVNTAPNAPVTYRSSTHASVTATHTTAPASATPTSPAPTTSAPVTTTSPTGTGASGTGAAVTTSANAINAGASTPPPSP